MVVGALLLLALVFALLVMRALGERIEHAPLIASMEPRAPTLIRDVRVFTGRELAPRDAQDVLLRDGRIAALGPTGTVEAGDATVIEGRGFTLLPGLVNAHVHVMAPGGVPWRPVAPSPEHNLEAWLAAGVTTVYDLGGPPPWLSDLARRVEEGELPGPRVIHGGYPMTAPESHPLPAGRALAPWPLSMFISATVYTIHDEEDARRAVASVDDGRLPYVKVIVDELPEGSPRLSPALLAEIVAEAHRRELKAFVHVGGPGDARAAAEAGADVIAHMIHRGTLDDETVRLLADARTPVIATLHGFAATAELAEGTYDPSELARRLHDPALVDPVTGAAGQAFAELPVLGEFAQTLLRERERWGENLRRLHAAGVPILVGTDAPLPGVLPGAAMHEELQALHEVGIPSAELLQAATWSAARLLDDAPEFGAVEVGMRADLLLVEGDPIADLTALTRIQGLWRDGRRVQLAATP